jgi:hypothetical protein
VKEAADATPVSSHSKATVAQAIPRPATHPPRLMRPTPVHRAAARPAALQRPATTSATARATTSTPQATTAWVSHTCGGAGLTAAAKHTVAKPRARTTHPTPRAAEHHTTAAHHTTTTSHASGGAQVKSKPSPAPVSSGTYVNPLAHASLTPERIDQGVDYSGSGTLTALGAGRVVATSGSGWPGDFIEYRLTSGAYAGRYIYYAESVAPVSGLSVGESVRPGQAIATISGGIEIGWGSGVGSQPLAQADGHWSSRSDGANYATPEGRSFSALIASLGGPPGKIEG